VVCIIVDSTGDPQAPLERDLTCLHAFMNAVNIYSESKKMLRRPMLLLVVYLFASLHV
jgi:hypothetical protein